MGTIRPTIGQAFGKEVIRPEQLAALQDALRSGQVFDREASALLIRSVRHLMDERARLEEEVEHLEDELVAAELPRSDAGLWVWCVLFSVFMVCFTAIAVAWIVF